MQIQNPFEAIAERLASVEHCLIDIVKTLKDTGNQTEADQLLTIQQASEFLNLSVPTLYGYVHRAEIPVMKKSKRLYFSKKLLHEWVLSGRKKTMSEIEAEAADFIKIRKK